MRMRRRSRGRSGPRSIPSRKVWGSWTTLDPITQAPGPGSLDNNELTASWLFSPNDAQDFYDEPTLVRMIFRFTGIPGIEVGMSNTLNWFQEIRAGIYLSREDEGGDGFSPTIMNLRDATQDWIWFQCWQLYHYGGDVLSISTIPATSGPYQGAVDLRTKRKIPEGWGIAMQIHNSDETLADTGILLPIRYATQGRFLLLDH